MKNIVKYFATAALAGVCFIAEAQDKPVKQKDQTQTRSQVQDGEHSIVYRNGQVMQMQNGELRPIEKDITLSNGSRVSRDGWITDTRGQRTRLQDGDIISMRGRVMTGGLAPESTTLLADGIYKDDGEIFVVENGVVSELSESRTLDAGISIDESGIVTLPTGDKTVLDEGDYLLMSGEQSTLFEEMKRCNCPKGNLNMQQNQNQNQQRELDNEQSQPDLEINKDW